MCTRPIKIRNNSYLKDSDSPIYYTVPCGHCPECLKKSRDSYELRAWKEFELCDKLWPGCSKFFLTLTYNNDNVPFYELDGNRKYCADFSDVQKMLKLFRKEINCGLRYFAVVEFGEQRGRVHYHLILITEKYFDPAHVLKLIQNKCWCRYNHHKLVGSLGFVHNVALKKDGNIRTIYNCVRYVCKYLTKYDTRQVFTKSQSLRVRCSLGFGLGPNHTNPFSSSELERGFVFLPYSQTNRYYIPNIYYNSMMDSYENLKKNARYVDYVRYIEYLIQDRFFDNLSDYTTNEEIRYQVTTYLHSKRFIIPEYQSIKLNRLVFSYKRILAQIPNLYLTNFFKDFDKRVDYISTLKSIASKYTEDDLLDCMLYVLPYLDRTYDGYYSPVGMYVSDKSIYADVVFLFNCLTFYIKCNQHLKNSLSVNAQIVDKRKSNYFKKLYYEQTNLSKSPDGNKRVLSPSKCRRSKAWYYQRPSRPEMPRNLSSSYCPF